GWRWNASKAFLRPVMKRPNLVVVTGTQAESLILDDKRCVGVKLRNSRRSWEVRARRDVVLAAGAVNTPKLLELSGIGEPARLRAAGVEVRHGVPGVGENLQDHLQLRTVVKTTGVPT